MSSSFLELTKTAAFFFFSFLESSIHPPHKQRTHTPGKHVRHSDIAVATMALWLFVVALIAAQHIAAVVGGGDDDSLCAVVVEGKPTSLVCPIGQVVKSIDVATFGTFENSTNNACPLPAPKPDCPIPVRAQVELFCLGRPNCTVSCGCDADLHPACRCTDAVTQLLTGFPAFPCNGVQKHLAVEVSCGAVGFDLSPSSTPSTMSGDVGAGAATNLQLEFLSAPVLGLDELRPQFTWTVDDQAAFQIDVVRQGETAPVVVVWTSGRVSSTSPMHVPAADLPLTSDTVRIFTSTQVVCL